MGSHCDPSVRRHHGSSVGLAVLTQGTALGVAVERTRPHTLVEKQHLQHDSDTNKANLPHRMVGLILQSCNLS